MAAKLKREASAIRERYATHQREARRLAREMKEHLQPDQKRITKSCGEIWRSSRCTSKSVWWGEELGGTVCPKMFPRIEVGERPVCPDFRSKASKLALVKQPESFSLSDQQDVLNLPRVAAFVLNRE